MASLRIGNTLRSLQLNVEGLSQDKCEVITRIAADHEVDLILLQETHINSEEDMKSVV